jgi:hypothetical protein
MGAFRPVHWMILAVIVVLLFGGYSGFSRVQGADRPFLKGMTRTSAFALSGALLVALALLTLAYGMQWPLGADPASLALGLASSGALLLFAAVISGRQSGNGG